MSRPAIRPLAAPLLVLGACACAHAGSALPNLDTAEASPPPVVAPVHRFAPFLRHIAFIRSAPVSLSSRSPVATLCADAQAKAVLDRDLPGLTTRPEFDMFKHMSLRTLQRMSGGKLSAEDVARVDADLAHLRAGPPASEPDGQGVALQKVALSQ